MTHAIRPTLLLIAGLLPLAAVAQTQVPRDTALTAPLTEVPVNVRAQPLATGEVTHQTRVRVPEGEAPVTVRSIQPDSVVGNYRIDFEQMDVDADGFISREEAQANPALADEFNALDTARRGKLAREQLAGWLRN